MRGQLRNNYLRVLLTLIAGLRLFPCYNKINAIIEIAISLPQKRESALLLASRGGHEAVVRLFIGAHALINLQDDVMNNSYLRFKNDLYYCRVDAPHSTGLH